MKRYLSCVVRAGLLVAFALGVAACRPIPLEVRTAYRWQWDNDEGRRCYYHCRSQHRFCASGCGGGSTVVWGFGGGWAVASHGPRRGCYGACAAAGDDCMRSCPGLRLLRRTTRVCPRSAPAGCIDFKTNKEYPAGTIQCRDASGRWGRCASPPPPPPPGTPPRRRGS